MLSTFATLLIVICIITSIVCFVANILKAISLSERPVLSLKFLSAELQEYVLCQLEVFLFWFGWYDLPPKACTGQRDTPIILVPGYGMNRLSLHVLKIYLNRKGYKWVWNINHPVTKDHLDTYAQALCEKAEHMRFRSGQDKVILIAHSMGGLVSRLAIQKEPHFFKALISLGTPWKSTATHIFTYGRSGKQMSPDSPYICHLWDESVPLHSIYSKQDWIILPPTNSIIEGAQNHNLPYVGHLSFLFSTPCFEKIVSILKEVDPWPEVK